MSKHHFALRIWSFDALRLFAMACVSLRHLMSISEYEAVHLPRFLGLGIFATLSGYLAFRVQREAQNDWLGKRLVRLYVPYWEVLGLMFIANAFFHYKPVSLPLFISQLAGTTYFTHPGQQLGIHTWFVSLLLLNTVLTVFLRSCLFFLPLFLLLTCYLMPGDSAFVDCVLAFLVGTIIARFGNHWLGAALVAALCAVMGLTISEGFLYPFAGSVGLTLALLAPKLSLPSLNQWGATTYEYYLVHGPIYLACVKVFDLSFYATLLVGTSVALVAAWLLRWLGRCSWWKLTQQRIVSENNVNPM